MKVIVLASGSKGNCTYIETDHSKILIDAGISFRQIKKRLEDNNISLSTLDGILMTHEHNDHTNGLGVLLGNIKTTLYMTQKCFDGINGRLLDMIRGKSIKIVDITNEFMINDLLITPFQLSHDSNDCVGYSIVNHSSKAVYLTDTGYVSESIYQYISDANLYIMEFNHDIEMLMNSNRDFSLINRILSDKGHLSNIAAAELFCNIKGKNTQILIPAHISQDCNLVEKISETIDDVFNQFDVDKTKYRIIYANQDETSGVLEI